MIPSTKKLHFRMIRQSWTRTESWGRWADQILFTFERTASRIQMNSLYTQSVNECKVNKVCLQNKTPKFKFALVCLQWKFHCNQSVIQPWCPNLKTAGQLFSRFWWTAKKTLQLTQWICNLKLYSTQASVDYSQLVYQFDVSVWPLEKPDAWLAG